jgi:hypothetical protein
LHMCASIMPPQGLFQPIYTVLQPDSYSSLVESSLGSSNLEVSCSVAFCHFLDPRVQHKFQPGAEIGC